MGARDAVGDLLRQRLLHAHHLLHEGAVEREAGQQREHAIPVEQVVVDPAAHQPEHVPERVVLCRDRGPGDSHQAAELPVDVLVDLAGEGERQRRGHAAVALDDVAVVPDDRRGVGIGQAGQRRDRPRLQQHEPVPFERPLDVLRRAEDCRAAARQPRHGDHLVVAERRLLDPVERRSHAADSAGCPGIGDVHAPLGRDRAMDDRAGAVDVPGVRVALARHEAGAEAVDGADDRHAAAAGDRIRAEGDARRIGREPSAAPAPTAARAAPSRRARGDTRAGARSCPSRGRRAARTRPGPAGRSGSFRAAPRTSARRRLPPRPTSAPRPSSPAGHNRSSAHDSSRLNGRIGSARGRARGHAPRTRPGCRCHDRRPAPARGPCRRPPARSVASRATEDRRQRAFAFEDGSHVRRSLARTAGTSPQPEDRPRGRDT